MLQKALGMPVNKGFLKNPCVWKEFEAREQVRGLSGV